MRQGNIPDFESNPQHDVCRSHIHMNHGAKLIEVNHLVRVLCLRQLVGWAGDLTTTKASNPSENSSNESIIVTYGFSVEVPKATLFQEQDGSAGIEAIREGRVMVPRLSCLRFSIGQEVDVAILVVSVVGESEFIDLWPPSSVETRDCDVDVVHWPNCTDKT